MLGKLFKYDFKSLGRILFPLYLGWILISVLMGCTLRFFADLPTFTLLMSFIYTAATITSVVVTILLIIGRFIKSIFGDEAYLMHTLPVKSSSLLFSKSSVATIFGIIGIIFGIISTLTIGFVNMDAASVGLMLQGFKELFMDIVHYVTFKDVLIFLEVLLLLVIGLYGTITKVFASISVGHSFNKHKILFSIVALIGFGVAELMIASIGSKLLSAIHVSAPMGIINLIAYSDSMATPFALLIGAALVQAGIYFFITNYFMKNKLNLE